MSASRMATASRTLDSELAICRECARREGWTGSDDEYEYSREDLDAVVVALGRRPTREEWEATGLTVWSLDCIEAQL